MSSGVPHPPGGEGRRDEDAFHVFDQTNGVLGTDDQDDGPREHVTTPPSSFGVPPIVSL